MPQRLLSGFEPMISAHGILFSLLILASKRPCIISAIRYLRIAPSWFCFQSDSVFLHAPGSSKVHRTQKSPSSCHAHCLSRHLLLIKKKNTTRIGLSGAIHRVMNSYFVKLFGRRCQDKVPLEEPNDTLHGVCGQIELGYPSKKQNNMYGCFSLFLSLTQSLPHSVHHLSLSFPSITHIHSISRCHFYCYKRPEQAKQLDKIGLGMNSMVAIGSYKLRPRCLSASALSCQNLIQSFRE